MKFNDYRLNWFDVQKADETHFGDGTILRYSFVKGDGEHGRDYVILYRLNTASELLVMDFVGRQIGDILPESSKFNGLAWTLDKAWLIDNLAFLSPDADLPLAFLKVERVVDGMPSPTGIMDLLRYTIFCEE